ncbi:MAG: hypothetical protein ACJAXJ_004311 [Colwellia sp.]|jgi:hypothetical protein
MKFKTLTLLALLVSCSSNAGLLTDFSGSLDSNLYLDIPNSVGSVSLNNSGTGTLDFSTTGFADMWQVRNNAPFAWTDSPTVALNDTWYVETKVSMPGTANGRLAGLTFYGDVDGSFGEFTFAIDNWNNTPSVRLQGLGDNNPNVEGLILSSFNPSVYLRTAITELGAMDSYTFQYKAFELDTWTTLTTKTFAVDNSRTALFLKNNNNPSQASFDYFYVGTDSRDASTQFAEVPEPTTLTIFALGMIGLASRRFKKQS